MKEGREYGSNLTTLPAVIISFVLFLTAAGFGQSGLAVFLFIVWLFALTAWAWARHSLSRLELTVEGRSCSVFPGGELSFIVNVKNGKLLPLFWLTVEFEEPVRGFIDLNDRHFGFIGPGRSVSLHEELRAEKRGVYHLKSVVLCSGDGLGLGVRRESFEPENRLLLVVYPRLVPVNVSLLRRQSSEMDVGAHGYAEDVTLLKSSRAYKAGDPARRINWRMLAAGAPMEVNVYENIMPRQATLIMDLESFGVFEEAEVNGEAVRKAAGVCSEELEDAISLAASVIVPLAQDRGRISLVLPSASNEKEKIISGSVPDEIIPGMLTALAGIDYSGGSAVFGRRMPGYASSGDVFAFVMDEPSRSCLDLLASVPEHRAHLISCGSGDAGGPSLLHRIEGRYLRA